MKRNLTFFFFLIGYLSAATGQNLVPNPSFENYISCPTFYSQIEQPPGPPTSVTDWFRPSCGTSDYFNACAPTGPGVPNNFFGHQPARTGNGYAGAYMMFGNPNGCREYIQALLTTTLTAGHQYYVSFWVSLAGGKPGNLSKVNTVAAYLGTGYINAPISTQIDFVTPQIINPANYIGDTTNWTRISGTFTATGTENCIVIGNFTSYAAQTSQVITGTLLDNLPYYYFDDVCVMDMAPNIQSHDTSFCGLSNGLLPGRAGLQEFLWNTGDTSSVINITLPGTYWVRSSGDCEAWIDTFHVVAYGDTIRPQLGNDTLVCYGAGITLNAGHSAFYNYHWSNGATTPATTVPAPGTYWVSAESSCGIFTDTIVLLAKPPVPAPPGLDTTICAGAGADIRLPYDQQGLLWYSDTPGPGNPQQPRINASQPGTYLFYVARRQDGCSSPLAAVNVRISVNPPVASLPEDVAVCEGVKVDLGQPYEGMRYQWSTGDTTCCITTDSSGIFRIRVFNYCGESFAESEVFISDCNRCLWAGNAFSPNGDGHNDRFDVKGLCPFKKFRLRIYNRYGQQIFTTDKVSNQWDGSYNGQPCDVGVYYYYLEAEPMQQEAAKIKKKGDITLIR